MHHRCAWLVARRPHRTYCFFIKGLFSRILRKIGNLLRNSPCSGAAIYIWNARQTATCYPATWCIRYTRVPSGPLRLFLSMSDARHVSRMKNNIRQNATLRNKKAGKTDPRVSVAIDFHFCDRIDRKTVQRCIASRSSKNLKVSRNDSFYNIIARIIFYCKK